MYSWLDKYIAAEAKHYGMPLDKYIALKEGAADYQERIEAGEVDEPTPANPA